MNLILALLSAALIGAAVGAYQWQATTQYSARELLRARESVALAYQRGGVLFLGRSAECLRMLTRSADGETTLTCVNALRNRTPLGWLVLISSKGVKPADVDLPRRHVHVPAVEMSPMDDRFAEPAYDEPIDGDIGEIAGWLRNPAQRPGPASNLALTTWEAAASVLHALDARRQAIKWAVVWAIPVLMVVLYILN